MPPSNKGPKQGPRGKVTPASMTKLDQTEKALELRRKGHTYRQIARDLGITLRSAHKLVADAFKVMATTTREEAAELYAQHVARLEGLYRGLAEAAESGNVKAVEAAVKVLDRQAKLCGLDQPIKIEQKVSVYQDMNDDELLREAERLKVSLPSAPDLKQLPLLPGERPLPAGLQHEVIDVEIIKSDRTGESPTHP